MAEPAHPDTAGPAVDPASNDLLQSLRTSVPSSESPPAAESAPAPKPATNNRRDDHNDIAALLQEYERGSGAKNGNGEPPPAAAAPPPKPSVLSDSDLLTLAIRQDQQRMFFEQYVHERAVEQARQQEVVDFNEVVGVANERLENMKHLPADYVTRFLFSQYAMDKEFQQAWDGRYQSEEHTQQARRITERVLKAMEKAARAVPTPESMLATQDHEAVAAAVRGASGRVPEGKPPDFARMPDGEFEQAKRRLFK